MANFFRCLKGRNSLFAANAGLYGTSAPYFRCYLLIQNKTLRRGASPHRGVESNKYDNNDKHQKLRGA